MKKPACRHEEASYRHKRPGGPWAFVCPICGRRSARRGLREAYTAFVQRWGAPVR